MGVYYAERVIVGAIGKINGCVVCGKCNGSVYGAV